MITGPSQDYADEQLRLADEALGDAKYLLNDNRLKASANRAYYAMFHAVHAVLSHHGVKPPKTHAGLISLFGKHMVMTGKVAKLFAKDLQDAYDLRQQTDYQVHARIGEAEVRDTVARADAFVGEVKRVVGLHS